jgi:phosphatidylserine decarboxylase
LPLKHPTIKSAKYQPYDALRQRFWRQYLKQYDAEESGKLSHIELTSMLDSLGSTLSRTTVDSFFTRHNKNPHDGELAYAEVIQCLEEELDRPDSEKKRIELDDSDPNSNVPATPSIITQSESAFMKLSLGELDFSGPHLGFEDEEISPTVVITVARSPKDEVALHSLEQSCESPTEHFDSTRLTGNNQNVTVVAGHGDSFERVINVKNCPLCHRPRLNAKAEVDIVTHLAVCASQDWANVNRIVVGNPVTASQAQRKWYTKVISKVSSGNYKLGAVSLVLTLHYGRAV